ncbi:DUF4097 family beta strand repeat-containing protein [Nonomuraea sp. NPDC050536]|uniref:DUF4097 family beta strand repeat-containing protein n=1 Tax=Nonomuraea sp. NPDC050536 TaxID=3364366 RepID=UPI0037C8BAF1
MRTMVIAGGLLASALLLTGCGLKSIGGPTNQETQNYQVTDKVTALQLKSGSGDSVISEYDGTAIRVTETLQWRDSKPKPQHKVNGDTLFMTYDCPSNWGSCSVDYKIEIPKGVKLDADVGSGNLTLRSLTGDLTLNAGSGDIDGSGLGGKKLFAEDGSGNIELKYAAQPDNVDMKTGSGDLTLRVPNGSYDVKTHIGSGDKNVTLPSDSGSSHKISVDAGSGDVDVAAG